MKDKKQKILIVHNYYQIPGGEDTVVANEKQMLEEHGHEIVLYTRNNSELKKMSKVQKLLLPFSTIFNIRTFREVRKIIKEQKIDIVHVHNTLNLISPSVYYAALSMRTPVVQTIHNFRLLCPGATFYREGHICEDCIKYGLGCAIKHNCYRDSKIQTLACVISTSIHRLLGIYGKISYICLTEFNKKKLLQLKQIREGQVWVKPNFVDSTGEFLPEEKRKNQFVFVGRLDKLKGIDFLLKTWKKMGKSAPKLLICGTGPMQEWCEEYIAENNLMNVEYRGFVPNEQAKLIIAESKALILPTQWYEGFPMTIVEAYSVGTPVIGPDFGNVGSIILEKSTGYTYQFNNFENLIKIVREEDFDISRTVVDRYQKLYSKNKNYQLMCEIYNRALKLL